MAKITAVDEQGELFGLVKVGEEVLSFNGKPFIDILDYVYADGQDVCSLVVQNKKGFKREITVEKDFDGDTLGLDFDDSVEIVPRECCNNCIFCFVKQLPKGMRDTLYVRDDDYRLSFVSGSYVTCTNFSEEDIKRIIEYRLSPLYVSVHATDESVRNYMLGRSKPFDVMAIMKRLIDAGIRLHTQIVLVGGVNDGKILEKSLKDLFSVGASSVAVVPVGLTKHRGGLPNVNLLTREEARQAVKTVEEYNSLHKDFCWCADEMYQIADIPVKNEEYYCDYPQIENGVGLITKFLSEMKLALNDAPKKLKKARTVALITGVSGLSTMLEVKKAVENKWKQLTINVYPIKNRYFGETVTVTGLVTASDIIAAFEETPFVGEEIIIPSVMLKEFDFVFLDGMSVEELGKKINKKILVSAPTGECLVDTLYYGE